MPVVVLTGLDDDETAQKALESGAQDYLVKGEITADSLERAIRYALGRYSTKEALRKSEEHFRLLFESSQDALMTLSPPSWKFTSCNPTAMKMFGAKDEREFSLFGPGEVSPDLQPDGRESADKAGEMIEAAMRDGSSLFEWTHKRLDGEEFPATVLLTGMEIGGETVVQATVRDITERKKAEDEINSLASRLMEEGEMVRASIAADLHDEIGQSLNAIKMAFDMQQKKGAGAADYETGERIASIRDMLSETIEKVRNISVELVPVELADFGLDSALENFLENFARETGAAFEFKTNGPPRRIGLHLETSLFRIAQEALTNVRKHSKADTVAILTSWSESLVVLSVRDNGVGFDVERAYEKSRAGEHFGLVAMRERARMHKGEFAVESKPGEGTIVTARVPLERS
jgi:PAS domain S-box-containing protein